MASSTPTPTYHDDDSLDEPATTTPQPIQAAQTTTAQTPLALTLPYDTSATPLILPRDWPDNFYYSDPHFDFQSNHLELAGAEPEPDLEVTPTLAGLGIKNIDLREVDSPSLGDDSHFGYSGPYERRSTARVHRTDAIYGVERNVGDAHTFRDHFPSASESPWTLSTFMKSTELEPSSLADETSAFDSSMDSAMDTSLELDNNSALTSQTSESSDDDNLALSFERLSAATGMSVAEFAEKLSATAEATLKRMAEGKDLVDTEAATPEDQLPLADINMRINESAWNAGAFGVNPADILPPTPPCGPNSGGDELELVYPVPVEHDQQVDYQDTQHGPLHMPHYHFDLQYTPVPDDLQSPLQERYILPLPAPSSLPSSPLAPPPLPLPPPAEEPAAEANPPSDDDDDRSVFQSPTCSEYSPPLPPTGTKRTQSSRIGTRRTKARARTQAATAPPPAEDADYYPDMELTEEQLANLPPINLGTPVFDAHRGIVLEELKAKAERYRLRNQGRDYDKRWLISFAGKLTHRGELLEEFRCYVAGCKQVNKRRDHILIHVGAHLDQRPFKCKHCSSRFLRKNECKRHELSHTGVRPFSCHLCPPPSTTFVRQDLLKRHMKRTHKIDFKIDKENDEPRRPKKRAKH